MSTLSHQPLVPFPVGCLGSCVTLLASRMGCGASAPVLHDPAVAVATNSAPSASVPHRADEAATPSDKKASPAHGAHEGGIESAAPGPQPAEDACSAPRANGCAEAGTQDMHAAGAAPAPAGAQDSSPRSGLPAAPSGVGGESAIAYHEGEDRLEWGRESYSAENLNTLLDTCDSGPVSQSLDEWLPSVREDANLFSDAYDVLRKSAGGPEALEEVAHECAVIRQKVLEDRGDEAGSNASFDRGEGGEEQVRPPHIPT